MKKFLIVCFTALVTTVSAQVKQSLERNDIRIGEQTIYEIYIENKVVDTPLPLPKDSIGAIEILGNAQIDSSLSHYIIRVPITAWDSGSYQIPSYKYKNYSSTPLTLKVNTVNVDTSQAIKPISDIMGGEDEIENEKSNWKWFWILLAIVLILGFYFWYKSKKGNSLFKKEAVVLTPYERVMRDLDELERKKAWQDEEHLKDYYATITNALREYLDEQYGMHAMESTSTELVEDFKNSEYLRGLSSDLEWLLQQADLAKFAKTRPSEEVNIQALRVARKMMNWLRPQEKEEK